MSDQGDFQEDSSLRDSTQPYTSKHPIPTVQKYREHRSELDGQQKQAEEAQHDEKDDSKFKRAFASVKEILKDDDVSKPPGEPYASANLNQEQPPQPPPKDGSHDNRNNEASLHSVPRSAGDSTTSQANGGTDKMRSGSSNIRGNDGGSQQTATEKATSAADPRQKRKAMKHNKRDDGGREVTDPVTHLPLVIRDSTEKDLKRAPENIPAPGTEKRTATGLDGASKKDNRT